MDYTTTVINLLGGPGCGKSTLAAELYADMKKQRMNVELVREVAKEWAWEGRQIGPFEQLAILGEQIKRESSLYTKVKYIVTDSPVVLGAFYFNHNHQEYFVDDMITSYYDFAKSKGVKFVNIVLDRTEQYDPSGRYETEEQALEIDKKIQEYLKSNCYDYYLVKREKK